MAENAKASDALGKSGNAVAEQDWSHLMQDAFSVIINEEKHPDPGIFT